MAGERARVPVEIHGRRFFVECTSEPLVSADGMVRGEFWDVDVAALIGPIERVADQYVVSEAWRDDKAGREPCEHRYPVNFIGPTMPEYMPRLRPRRPNCELDGHAWYDRDGLLCSETGKPGVGCRHCPATPESVVREAFTKIAELATTVEDTTKIAEGK